MLRNRNLVAFAVVVLTGFAAAPSLAGLEDGLRNYWEFNGSLNDVAGDFAGTANTVVDNGTFAGANGTDGIDFGPGNFGGGIEQNGAGGGAGGQENDGFVLVPRSADTLYGSTSTVTTSMWVKAAGFDTNWQTMLAHGEGNQYRIARRGGDVPPVASYAGGSGDIPASGIGPALDDDAWHHVLAISEGGVSTRIWVDGGLVETGAAPTIDDNGNGNPNDPDLYIGANPQTGANNREWWGEIDDVGQWDRVLTDVEIGSIYEAGQGGAPLATLIPEPSSVTLLLFGLLGLRFRKR